MIASNIQPGMIFILKTPPRWLGESKFYFVIGTQFVPHDARYAVDVVRLYFLDKRSIFAMNYDADTDLFTSDDWVKL